MSQIIDSQVHAWLPERSDRPWPHALRSLAKRVHGRDALDGETLLSMMSRADIDRAVLVPPFFEGFRNDFALEIASEHPSRFRVMARVDPREDTFITQVTQLALHEHVVGFRFVFLDGDIGSLNRYLDHPMWAALTDSGLPVAIHAPGQIDDVSKLGRSFQDLRILLDHCGLSGDPEKATQELASIRQLSVVSNISLKLSGLTCSFPNRADWPAALNVLADIVEGFGWERTAWGSDVTRIPGGYAESLEFTRRLVPKRHHGAALGGNLSEILKW